MGMPVMTLPTPPTTVKYENDMSQSLLWDTIKDKSCDEKLELIETWTGVKGFTRIGELAPSYRGLLDKTTTDSNYYLRYGFAMDTITYHPHGKKNPTDLRVYVGQAPTVKEARINATLKWLCAELIQM